MRRPTKKELLKKMLSGLTATELKKAIKALATDAEEEDGYPTPGQKGDMVEGITSFFYPPRKRKKTRLEPVEDEEPAVA